MSNRTNASLKEHLIEKMRAEQDKYRNWLLSLEPEEILNHTHEYTTREDILIAMGMRQQNLADEQYIALLSLPDSLNTIFKEVLTVDFSIEDSILEVAAYEANRIMADEDWNKGLSECADESFKVPVYYQTPEYAFEHGELDAYRASEDANNACLWCIQEMVEKYYKDNSLNTDHFGDIVTKFGVERTAQVFASIINSHSWDGRYSHSNKEWASATSKLVKEMSTSVHPILVNRLVDILRKEYNT